MLLKQELKKIIDNFIYLIESKKMPLAIKEITFPRINAPSNNWSSMNKLILFLNETNDARGYNQWKLVKRNVKKGSKAFHIFAPRLIKDEEEQYTLIGFKAIPVFKKEDTEGEELDYEKINLPELPLLDTARKWNINVKTEGFNGYSLGSYNFSNKKEIKLSSSKIKVFLHELAHASQDRLGFLNKDKNYLEVTAELSALVLAEYLGYDSAEINSGATYEYIKNYLNCPESKIIKEILKVIEDVLKIVENIVKEELS